MPHLRSVAIASALAVFACTSTAFAAKPTSPPSGSKSSCPTKLTQPFALDPASYYLAPGGDFEKSAWSGGTRVTENDPFGIGGVKDRSSLEITSAADVVSPAMCIGVTSPTTRFAVRRTSLDPMASLTVSLRYVGIDDQTYTVPFTTLTSLAPSWELTAPTPLLTNALVAVKETMADPLNADEKTADAQFVFTPSPGSTWRVDDVYVDPYSRR